MEETNLEMSTLACFQKISNKQINKQTAER